MNEKVYKALCAIVKVLFAIFSPVKAIGVENIPQGAVIFAANHMSLTDPIKMACVIKKPISFMAKKELFGIWGLRKILAAVGTFPVDRSGSDFSSVKLAISIIDLGGSFGIFPQGSRTYKGGAEFKTGVALIAARTAVPVIPVYIDGRTRLFKTTHITFGKPVDIGGILKRPNSVALSEATRMIENAVYALGANS